MTNNNSIKYNTHARTSSLSVYNLGEDMKDNYETSERIKNKEIADLFAPEFLIKENKLSLGYREDMKDNYKIARRIRERNLIDLFAPEFERR